MSRLIGFIDNEVTMFEDYIDRLDTYGIELICTSDYFSFDGAVDWIASNRIKTLMVDYKLIPEFQYCGTELVSYVNKNLPDLPCIIFTNYPDDSIGEQMVVKNLIYDKSILRTEGDRFMDFISVLKHSTRVFDKRLQKNIDEFKILKYKKENKSISTEEEERFITLFKILRNYGEVDDLPLELMKSEIEAKIDDILEKLD